MHIGEASRRPRTAFQIQWKSLTVAPKPICSAYKCISHLGFSLVHPTGNSFVNYQNIPGTSLVVNTDLNAAQVRSHTRNLLKHCGINPDNVQLQVGE